MSKRDELLDENKALRAELQASTECRLANELELVRADGIIGELRAEVEALKDKAIENTGLSIRLHNKIIEVETLNGWCATNRARIAALEAALERYGMHLRSCEMLPRDPDRNDPHCTCGLNKALRGEVGCTDSK